VSSLMKNVSTAFAILGLAGLMTACSTPTQQSPTTRAAFPLNVSADGKHLIDQDGVPFLIQGDAAWSLIASPTESGARQYLENRRLKGFNAVLVNLLEHKFTAHAPADAAGDQPFTAAGDFSTPNEAYFRHVDRILEEADAKGILVMLAPAYLGFEGGDEGWYQEMVANGETSLRDYGRYLGARYKDRPNILWVNGGDYRPSSNALVNAVALGILDEDPNHLHTGHCDRGHSAADCFGSEPWLTVDSSYTSYVTYDQVSREAAHVPARPSFLLEAIYENEGEATPVLIRSQAYRALLAGAQGQTFGNDPIWSFDGPSLYPPPYSWQTAMDAQGSRDMARLGALLRDRAWAELVPDRDHAVVTSGYGTYATDASRTDDDYATTSRTADGTLSLTYLPTRRTVTVDLTRFSGQVTAKWYDPTNGDYATISGSPFEAVGSRQFTPTRDNSAGDGDWVLVLEVGS